MTVHAFLANVLPPPIRGATHHISEGSTETAQLFLQHIDETTSILCGSMADVPQQGLNIDRLFLVPFGILPFSNWTKERDVENCDLKSVSIPPVAKGDALVSLQPEAMERVASLVPSSLPPMLSLYYTLSTLF